MKSAVFYGKHDLRVEESAEPAVGRRDVLINVKACGVCGTDVHIYEGDKGAADVTPPTILGHEFAGVVEAVGSDVAGFKPGDRVCIDPNHTLRLLRTLPRRNQPLLRAYDRLRYHRLTAALPSTAPSICSKSTSWAYHTSFEQGAMTEPVACCLHGIDMCSIKPGSTVVVIGGGMIGLLMMQLAKNAGATKVVLLEPVEGKREVALKLGADLAIDSIHEDVPARLKQEGVGNVDVVIECVGKPVTIEQAIQIAGHKATVMMFGLTKPDETITVKPFEVFQKELVLTSSYINPYTQRRALELIDSGRLDVSSMVAKVASLDELGAILSDPALRAMGKYIIDPSK